MLSWPVEAFDPGQGLWSPHLWWYRYMYVRVRFVGVRGVRVEQRRDTDGEMRVTLIF